MPYRRFSQPWDIDDNGASFIVRDHNGQALAYVYFEEEPGRRAAANLLARLAGGKFSAWQWRSPRYFSRRSGSGGSLAF